MKDRWERVTQEKQWRGRGPHKRRLTLVGFVAGGVHVGQSDVGVAQPLHPANHQAPLLPHLTDDLVGHVAALLQEGGGGRMQEFGTLRRTWWQL